jgi:hypothetical protein
MSWLEPRLSRQMVNFTSLTASGNHLPVASPTYPEDSLQYCCDPWWIPAADQQLRRGRLVWAFVPHVDQQPYVLVAKGRSEPTEHRTADFIVEPLQGHRLPVGADLPVAGLPQYPGEVRLAYRAKRRPVLVLGTGGTEIPKALRTGAARYQTNSTILAAPYYGADLGGSTGGWRPEFVERIRRCEYPQYMWDSLPIRGRKESILRLDHLQPISKHGQSYEMTEYELHSEALSMVDEYLTWLLQGQLPVDSVLLEIRRVLLGVG